jgi:hypothetical protein
MHLLTRATALSAAFFALHCGRDEGPAAGTPSPDATGVARPSDPMKGAVRFDDAWLPVAPFVAHQGRMDLATQCLVRRDDAIAAGQGEIPLCYERAKRERAAIKTLRVELGRPSLREVVAALRGSDESAHFLVERSGSIYQVLDLVHGVRRDEVYRTDEIRIASAGPNARENAAGLVSDLERLFPGLKTNYVEVK